MITQLITDKPFDIFINKDSHLQVNKIEVLSEDETPDVVKNVAIDYDVLTKGDEPTQEEIDEALKSFVDFMNESFENKFHLVKD